MPSAQPDIVATVQGAFRDAWPVMRSRMSVYGVFAAICAVAGLAVPLAHLGGPDAQDPLRIQMAIQPANICGAIASFFVMAAVARTARPDFRMTFLRVLGIFGIGLAVGIVTEIGFFLLIVPGVLFCVKWSQATWNYLLSDGENPFGESWELTTGHFWETLGFMTLLALLLTVVLAVGFFLPAAIAIFVPVLAVLLAPIALLGYVFADHVAFLAQMRWMLELRRLAPLSAAVGPTSAP